MGVADRAADLGGCRRSCDQGERGEKTDPAGEMAHEPSILVPALRRGQFLHSAAAVRSFVGQRGEEFRDGFVEDRMTEMGCDLAEGREDESAAGEGRVRDGEARRVEDQIVHEQQVQVEGAGVVDKGESAIAAVAALGGKQEVEQGLGIEGGR